MRLVCFLMLAGACAAAADPVTVTSGSLESRSFDQSLAAAVAVALDPVTIANGVPTNVTGTSGNSVASTDYTITSSGSSWRLEGASTHTYAATALSSFAASTAIVRFTLTKSMRYEASGLYNQHGMNAVVIVDATLDEGVTTLYDELDRQIGDDQSFSLDNVADNNQGQALVGLRSGVLGPGDYDIRFNFQSGSIGAEGGTASGGFVLELTVIPLPSGAGLALVGLGVLGVRRRR